MAALSIGPNSIIQTLAALRERFGEERMRELLSGCASTRWIDEPPDATIDETAFREMVDALNRRLGMDELHDTMLRSGRRTAEYVLAHRLPPAVGWLVKFLRKGPGPMLLLQAIALNARTFGESGSYRFGTRPVLHVEVANPVLCSTPALAAAVCRYYRGAFERLFEVLIDPSTILVQERCQADGAPACVYRITKGVSDVR